MPFLSHQNGYIFFIWLGSPKYIADTIFVIPLGLLNTQENYYAKHLMDLPEVWTSTSQRPNPGAAQSAYLEKLRAFA